ncbi:MAG: hypothetical protein HFE66_03210 [Clostridiales bacterium]|jgi:hypothetical protein|nr:hypothetical protein [Clostridiales bacterium]MCI8771722.1 hypothetical protein [Lachnospiraceae bacterium]
MDFFNTLENKLSYKDILQIDGAFAVAHVNYNKSPMFNGVNGKNLAKNSRKNSLSSQEKIDNVIECIDSFDGTEKIFKKDDRISLWRNYWLEYINAFDKLVVSLPSSVVTIYVGRQAIEIGFKYLLLKKTGQINITHDLGELANLFFAEYKIHDSYMNGVDLFCEKFCKYIEGGNVEYFRYPEYKKNTYFAGNHLDIEWLSYNFVLIILKLIHFANLDTEI